MAEPFLTYYRTVKFPCESLESGRVHKEELDASITTAAKSLASEGKQLRCELGGDAAGHLNATLKTESYMLNLQTQFGQNIAYLSGERQTFISYSISAESRVPALDRAADAAERLRIMMMLAGGLAGAGLIFAGVEAMLDAVHHAIIPRGFIAIALIFGGWCGGKLGHRLGLALENRAIKRAEARGVTADAESLWSTLIQKLDGITSRYERA